MVLTNLGLIMGLTASTIVLVGFFFGLHFIIKYFRQEKSEKKDILILLTAVVFIALASSWLGVTLSFIKILIDKEALPHELHIWAYAWGPAIGVMTWTFIVFSLIKPKYRYIVLSMYFLISIPYFLLLYLNPTDPNVSTYELSPDLGGLPDTSFKGIPMLILMIFILTAFVIIAPMYIYVGIKTIDPEIRIKGMFIGTGSALFALFAIIDGLMAPETILLLITRSVILGAFILMYLGYTLPSWLKARLIS